MRRFLIPICALGFCVLSGCASQPLPTAEERADAVTRERTTGLGRSVTLAEVVETDNAIAQINAALSMVRADNDGRPPATLEEAQASVREVPASMWIDRATGRPLVYDPNTGTVSRDGGASASTP